MQTEGKKGTSAHAKEVAAKSKKYYDNEALKREKSGETYNVGNAKVTKPAVKESGLGGVPWGMQNEGRFTHGTGGVPLDRRGNPIPPKVKEPRAPAGPRRDSNGLTKDDYSKVWRKIEDVVSNIFPDGDPIDWLAPWLNRSGIRDHHVGEVLEKACKMNGYADVYAYYDSFKTADYGWNEGVTEGVEQKVHPSSLGQFLYYALLVNLNDISSPYREGTPEYEEFAEAFRHAFADQNRRYLRLHNDLATLARVFNIPNYEKYLQNANKQGVKEGYDGWGEKEVTEASPDTTINLLKGLKSWQVVIRNNYYNGKYSDYSGRYYYVIASSPEEAKEVVLDNADGILQDLLTKKSNKGKKILPRGSAIPITDKQIGDIKDGTVSGRMSTMGFVKLFSPQGPIMVKLAGGQIDDVQGQEQGIEEDAVDDYFARGGKATVGKYHNPRKVEAPGFGSKHIGSGSGRGTTKGQVSGLKANTHPNGGKPVVTAGKQVDNTKQVNELSAETLNKYASAANRNRSEVSAAHSAEGKWDPKIVDKMDRRADSSMKAYNKANAQKGQS
jgi:hypothetical protein